MFASQLNRLLPIVDPFLGFIDLCLCTCSYIPSMLLATNHFVFMLMLLLFSFVSSLWLLSGCLLQAIHSVLWNVAANRSAPNLTQLQQFDCGLRNHFASTSVVLLLSFRSKNQAIKNYSSQQTLEFLCKWYFINFKNALCSNAIIVLPKNNICSKKRNFFCNSYCFTTLCWRLFNHVTLPGADQHKCSSCFNHTQRIVHVWCVQ